MIDTLLITDTETTGIEPSEGHVTIEVAIVVFSIKTASIIECFSSLIKHPTNAAQSINRISPESLAEAACASYVWGQVNDCIQSYTHQAAFLAHRAEFDKKFYRADIAAKHPWICSKFDIDWPRGTPGASLVELALAHDIPVHANHRALTDCLLLAKILERAAELGPQDGIGLAGMIALAMRPKTKVQALVSFADKQKAKDAGFGWDGKIWSKNIATVDLEHMIFNFKTKVLENV